MKIQDLKREFKVIFQDPLIFEKWIIKTVFRGSINSFLILSNRLYSKNG